MVQWPGQRRRFLVDSGEAESLIREVLSSVEQVPDQKNGFGPDSVIF